MNVKYIICIKNNTFYFDKSINIVTFASFQIVFIMKKYKVKEVIDLLLTDGWIELPSRKTSGDHRQFKHPTKKGKVTIRGKNSDVLNQFLLNSIWHQAGWK